MAKLFKSEIRPSVSGEEPPVIKVIQGVDALAKKLNQMFLANKNEDCKKGSKILEQCEINIINYIENKPSISSDTESHDEEGFGRKPIF